MYIKNKYKARILLDITSSDSRLELLWVELTFNNKKFVIGGL